MRSYSPLIYSILFISIISLFQSPLKAQKFGFGVDFFGYADNREFKTPYTIPKTFFGTTISPKFYFQIEKDHRIYGGVHINQEFGLNSENRTRVNPIAYYNYNNTNIDFAIGFIPRDLTLKDIPKMVLADTLMYDRPNLEGMYFQYKNSNFKQVVYIDWISKQGRRNREQFITGIRGRYNLGKFFIKNDGLLYHNALSSNDSLDEHIQDNGILMGNVGLDLSNSTVLDSLLIQTGAAIGFDRIRNVSGMKVASGFISTIYVGYKRFFLENSLYLGKPMNLPNGDPFYHRASYDRIDLGWIPFKTKRLEGKFIASFHFSKGHVDNQQAFLLRYNFAKEILD